MHQLGTELAQVVLSQWWGSSAGLLEAVFGTKPGRKARKAMKASKAKPGRKATAKRRQQRTKIRA